MEQAVRSLALSDRDLIISVHTEQNPSGEEWGTLITALKESEARKHGDISRILMLMLGDGGSPDTLMRDALNKVLRGRPMRMSVVTDSVVTHGVVTAIGWFNSEVRAYATAKSTQALTHLALSADEIRQTTDALNSLSRLIIGVHALDAMLTALRARPEARPGSPAGAPKNAGR